MTDCSDVSTWPVTVNRDNARAVFSKYDTLLFDMDGVLWGQDHLTFFPGVDVTLHKLREAGKHILFVTNNCIYERHYFQVRMIGQSQCKDQI